jgi:hypothetical protein
LVPKNPYLINQLTQQHGLNDDEDFTRTRNLHDP